jgi:hypothetical protein
MSHFLDEPESHKTEVDTTRRLSTRLRELLDSARTPGFWGSVSLEVFVEDGRLVRFRELVQRTHKS